MKTIKLEVSNKVYTKILWLLKQFKPEEVRVVQEKESIKKYLSEELSSIEKGSSSFLTVEELDQLLEERISKHEN
ncbi:MAG TPA: hypothetical protein DEG69_08665 [Flavobacteriaceae bacterium]|jgi:hypothetical protein|nr:hypothetical protein [Flavobacteriaceae bacterium]|tara:strand:+ start:635 stop:859 length:225 start_codon:yes stop_codon:yes gene_type:complete